MQTPGLSILNAESYDDGNAGFQAPRSLPATRRSRGDGDVSAQSKKRPKAQPAQDGEVAEEEEKKRSRGRPRLDTNDETAKDRRRTQIRLAQRAYRNRKESTIQKLQKDNDELLNANEEMSKAFMKLYDFAVSKGMHETTPDFGRQLQATTEKFVALAQKSNKESLKEDGLPASEEPESDEQPSPARGREKASEKTRSPLNVARPDEHMLLGFTTGLEGQVGAHPPLVSRGLTAVHTTSWAAESQAHSSSSTMSQAPLGYEIITEPTADNASFPFGMSLEHSSNHPGGGDPLYQTFLDSSFIFSQPSTYAYQERTFGRRLQRSTAEKAYMLISWPNAPTQLITSVFGFCLLFESREQIRERIANRLRVTDRESLFHWKYPFLNLGGNGSFFPELHSANAPGPSRDGGPRRPPVGNEGADDPDRPKVPSAYGIGPWDAQTEEVREMRLDRRLRMTLPGFIGDFYDPDEIEWVLQQRGVYIPAAADFVEAEINPVDFSNETSVGGRAIGSSPRHIVPSNAGEPAGFSLNNISANLFDNQWTGHGMAPGTEKGKEKAADAPGEAAAPQVAMNTGFGPGPFGYVSGTPVQSRQERKKVLINVEVLVRGKSFSRRCGYSFTPADTAIEIGLRSICLGRAPGIRPHDLNTAFWTSITEEGQSGY
ncbi:hypothetical protein CCHL11_06491, partial [Colletotrichum chlorophyti]